MKSKRKHPGSPIAGSVSWDAICGIQRGLDSMKAGTGKPLCQALAEIRASNRIPPRKK